MSDHYTTLGITRHSTLSDIRRAYRNKALKCHPDKNPAGESEFKSITAAYHILCDATARQAYDNTLPTRPPPTETTTTAARGPTTRPSTAGTARSSSFSYTPSVDVDEIIARDRAAQDTLKKCDFAKWKYRQEEERQRAFDNLERKLEMLRKQDRERYCFTPKTTRQMSGATTGATPDDAPPPQPPPPRTFVRPSSAPVRPAPPPKPQPPSSSSSFTSSSEGAELEQEDSVDPEDVMFSFASAQQQSKSTTSDPSNTGTRATSPFPPPPPPRPPTTPLSDSYSSSSSFSFAGFQQQQQQPQRRPAPNNTTTTSAPPSTNTAQKRPSSASVRPSPNDVFGHPEKTVSSKPPRGPDHHHHQQTKAKKG
eukprot:PhM_4_TR13180/c0_g1_i1/m.56194